MDPQDEATSPSRDERLLGQGLVVVDRMASVGRLAAGVAHEINNPLAYVAGNLAFVAGEFARLGGDLRRLQATGRAVEPAALGDLAARLGEMEEILHEACEGTERVRVIVRDIKAFSRGDEGGTGPVDVRRVIEAAINMAWSEIRHRARLEKDFAEVPPVEANEVRLGQVVLNLLVNAAHAIPEGQADRNRIRVALRREGEHVLVEVRDSGAGIPPELLPRIFEPFFTTREQEGGTGIGLSISRAILEQMGGSLEAESPAGEGATFRVRLPVERAGAVVPEEPRRGRVKTDIPRSHILVIDDEPMFLRAFQRLFGRDHDVVVAQGGREALAILLSGAFFDLVLCDLMMPDLSGMDVWQELERQRPGLQDCLVFTTGGAFTPRAREFLGRVGNMRIEKPFDVQNVRALLKERRRMRR